MKQQIKHLLEEIRAEAQQTVGYTGRAAFAERVLAALAAVPREGFVPHDLKAYAYINEPLPIGDGQTISQPYIVALMTDLLDLTPQSIVLEIGTGSGYQAAVLSRLATQVYSVECLPELAAAAATRLHALGYDNIEVRCGNGYEGWPEHAPYDAIMVTAAAPYIPPALIEQLKTGGRMVIPVGLPAMHQELMLVTKNADGTTRIDNVLPVAFVPLVADTGAGSPPNGESEA